MTWSNENIDAHLNKFSPCQIYGKKAGHDPFRCVTKRNKSNIQENTSVLGSLAQITVLCLMSTAPGISSQSQRCRWINEWRLLAEGLLHELGPREVQTNFFLKYK